ARGVDPRVVDDQTGRLTFTADIATAITHLLQTDAPAGTYNVTGTGRARSWAEIAREVYRMTGHDPERVTAVGTDDYYSTASGPVSPRPRSSLLDVSKIISTGFTPSDSETALDTYLAAPR